jgi:hypothetical protein
MTLRDVNDEPFEFSWVTPDGEGTNATAWIVRETKVGFQGTTVTFVKQEGM